MSQLSFPTPPPKILMRCKPFLAHLFGGEHRIPEGVTAHEFPGTSGSSDSVDVPLLHGIATYDHDRLTQIVVLAHLHRLRAEVSVGERGPFRGKLILRLWDRAQPYGRSIPQHPGLTDLVKHINQTLGDHGDDPCPT